MTLPAFQSVADMFLYRIVTTPEGEAFRKPVTNGWQSFNWKQTGEEVRAIACGLRALGVVDEQRCSILSETRLEWIFADLGTLTAGAATTTIYPKNTAEECLYILQDSDTVVLFAENNEQVQKIAGVRDQLPNLKKIVVFEGPGGHDGWVISLEELKKIGNEYHQNKPTAFEATAKAVTKDRIATLIYTSGTTGKPKGVVLTHDQWLYEAEGIDALHLMTPQDVQYFWLPLAHVFGKVVEMAQVRIGFCTAIDGRIDKIIENLAVVQPTFMCAVPRIFEKVHNKVVATAREGGGMKWKIFQWAFRIGREVSQLKQQGKEPSGFLAMKYSIATKLVFSKLHQRFGGRLRFFISGSAPLSKDIAEFFHAADLLILEGYGLTESSAASFVNRPESYRFGRVGLPLPGTEVKLMPEDGEILIRGRGIMRGYHHLPEATAEALTQDGWLRTGDIGEVDEQGFLKITDRKKDLIKTSGGKYIAPQAVEGKLKAICPFISQVVVHGDNRNFSSALIAIDPEAIQKWANDVQLGKKNYGEIVQDPKVHQLIAPYIQQLNSGLASYESIKKFSILPRDLTVEEGDLTPSLKLKRKVVEKKFMPILDGFYSDTNERL